MSLFCAFVRDAPEGKTIAHSEEGIDPHKPPEEDRHLAKVLLPRLDVETIVEMISDRSTARIALEKNREVPLDLRAAHLQRASFKGADLSKAVLDFADLTYADLRGADLRDATLGLTTLKGARNLTQAQLDQAGGHDDQSPKLDGVYDAQTGKLLVWRQGD